MNKETTFFGAIGAIIVPVFQYLYGAGDVVIPAMTALLFFIILDWISGTRAAEKDDSYASKYGIDGLFRTFFMLLLPAGGNLLDKLFGLPSVIFGALAASLLYHVIKSMTANAIRAGWGEWLPINVLEALLKWVGSEIENKIKRSLERGGMPDKVQRDVES